MALWTSWMVLAACAVIAQSFPRPDEYVIPDVPNDKRVQYYVLHDDGNYKYGYDTGVGAYESAVKMGSDLVGYYGFNDASGDNVRIDYTAGTGGFVPVGNTIPEAAPVASLKTGFHSAIQTPVLKSASASVRQFENADVDSTNNLDGSYSFSYSNSDSSRSETADASNNVFGKYSFVADDGKNREIRYRAGSATGYIAEGDSIPKVSASAAGVSVSAPAHAPTLYTAPARAAPVNLYTAPSSAGSVSASESHQPRGDASYSFSYTNEDSAREESSDSDLNVQGSYSFIADDGVRRNVNYIAGSDTGFVAKADHLPVAPKAEAPSATQYSALVPSTPVVAAQVYSAPSQPRGDASYQFSYKNSDSSRSESADSDLNVNGDFSFVADDGQLRKVTYIAGASTGFVAQGDHLPVAPEVPASHSASALQYSAPTPVAATSYTANIDQSSAPRRDASYNFKYQNEHSSRSETADRDLNVQGEYSFLGDDGQTRKVTYRAGSGTGFVAEGDHLPRDEPISPAFTSVNTYSASSGPNQFAQAAGAQHYGGDAPLFKASQSETANVASDQGVDGSYSFSYSNSDSSRSESADAANNVVGEYSFIADDGKNRQIRYRAGSATGFVAEGDSIPVAPKVSPVQSVAPVASATLYSAPASSGGSVSSSQPRGDASYSFNYNTGDQSRDETADSDLNVEGSYSFIADDGVRRQVNYVAGSSTGFVAEGSHLPVAGEVSSVGSAANYRQGNSNILVKSAPTAPVVSHAAAANTRTNFQQGGGYSFGYTNSDSSRSESADASNNVVGQYSFVADDGINRQINYRAGSATGYVAEGDSIPVAPLVPRTTGIDVHVQSPPVSLYSAPSAAVSQQSFEPRGDASYSFSYANEDSTRQENADSDLNVKGSFSFVADDGVQRKVNYIAGSATGFIAEGDHLPVAPKVTGTSGLAIPTSYSAGSGSASSTFENSGAGRGDASYSFKYAADDSSRDETADRDLNVKGRYTFVADDGVERTVNYRAGSATGFVAEGAHLPVQGASVVSGTGSSLRSSGASSSSGSSSRGAITYSYPTPSKPLQVASTRSGSSSSSSSSGTTIGNVKLNQYAVGPGQTKYGYSFIEI